MNGVRQRRPLAPAREPVLRSWLAPALKVTAAVTAVSLTVAGGFGGWQAYQLSSSVASGDNLTLGAATHAATSSDDPVAAADVTSDGATDILLVGSDSRTDAQGNPLTADEIDMLRAGDVQNVNTDTIVVARLAEDGSTLTAVSIPRDSYITDRTFGNTKINGVYGMHMARAREELTAAGEDNVEERAKAAGRQALIEAVGTLTGVDIDHYAEVGLLGFVLLTDAVGGVDVCLNESVSEPLSGADFAAGVQTLNGADGLSFVRQRYGLPRGDLDRITRQQVFMAGLARNVLSAGTLTSPSRLSQLTEAVERSVVLDSSWNIADMVTQLQGIQGADIRFDTIPVVTIDGVGDNGESVVEVDTAQVHGFFREIIGAESDSSLDRVTSAVSARVYNASDVPGAADDMAARLTEAGVVITEVGNAHATWGTSPRVIAAPGNDMASEVATVAGLPLVYDDSVTGAGVIVITAPAPAEPAVIATAQEQAPPPGGSGIGVDAAGEGPTCVN